MKSKSQEKEDDENILSSNISEISQNKENTEYNIRLCNKERFFYMYGCNFNNKEFVFK